MLNTLYAKLALALTLILILVGAVFGTASWYINKQHAELVVQTFNKDLASNLISERKLIHAGEINKPALQATFSEYMEINPSIEIYLLDNTGKIISYSAPPEKVVRDKVSLNSIREFLKNKEYKPVLGDDPRSLERGKPFSVAPINTNAGMFGYLYIVLRGEAFDAVDRALQQQYLVKLGLYALFVSLIVGLVAGLLIIWFVTRRLRRLTDQVEQFQSHKFTDQVDALLHKSRFRGDELDRLACAFMLMSQRIKNQIGKLEENDKKRRDLIANVSHDLRTPLAAMLGYLDTLKTKVNVLNAVDRDDCIETALRNAHRMSELIDELFELAKLEAGGAKLSKEPFAISDLVQDVVRQQSVLAQQKNVALEIESPERLPLVVGDIALIQRVLENLLSNAISHVDRIGKVIVRMMQSDGRIKISIWDSGAQIDSAEVPQLFDRFYQGSNRDERKLGAGLGLSIAKQILSLHESTINVDNKESGGKEFSFELRARTTEETG